MSRKITNPVPDIDFDEYRKYYEEHTREETCKYFNITVTQHRKLCKLNNYKKPLNLVNIDRDHRRSKKLKELWADKNSIYNSDEFLSKRAETLKSTWATADKSKWGEAISEGINNMSEEAKEHKSALLSNIHNDKSGYFQSNEYKDLLSKKQSEAWQSESTRNKHKESYEKVVETMYNTKKKNGTFNTSKPEIEFYSFLQNMYPDSVIINGYRDNVRYPFNCDFYIESIDEFIELNAHWTHGPHPFDPSNENDIKLLNKWRSKQGLTKNGKKNSYYKAEEVWTVRDPNKLAIAKQNNLNYVMIYKEGAFFI